MRIAIHRLLLVTAVCTLAWGQNGDLVRASQVMGVEVRGAKNTVLGTVKDVVLDRKTGGVTYAVVSFGGLQDKGVKLFAVPWQALAPSADGKALVLANSKAALASVSGFEQDKWPDVSDRRWVDAVAAAYGVRRPQVSRTDDEPRVIGTRETTVRAPRAVPVVTGTVRSILPGEASEVVIDTRDGEVDAVLGPLSYLDEQRLTFNPNANVTVQGYPTMGRDGPKLVVTGATTHPGQWVRIRNNDLTPAWDEPVVDADGPRQVRDLTGTVTYAGNGVATVLTDDEGVRVVSIAPWHYFESRHWALRKNLSVTVTGFDDPFSRDFVAITVDHGHETWRVRRDDGTPLWRDD